MTDYFFTIIDLGNASFGNEYLFTQQKENSPLLIFFGKMYIDFDEYPRNSDGNSENFEKKVNANIQCVHGYAYSSGKQKMCTLFDEDSWVMMKTCFPDAL